MQRFILLMCLTAFVVTSPAFAQQLEDVVHLKNGGLIRGTIIEQIPGESLKIKTRDGNVFVYTMDEVAKMSREPVMKMRGHIVAKKKNPWIAGGLSLLIPGAGQAYNGQFKKGLTQLGFVIVGTILEVSGELDKNCKVESEIGVIVFSVERNNCENRYGNYYGNDGGWKTSLGSVLRYGGMLSSVIDAYLSANRINRQNQQPSYGHLIEIGGSRATLGVDPVVSHKNLGTRLTLHF